MINKKWPILASIAALMAAVLLILSILNQLKDIDYDPFDADICDE